MVVSLLRQIIQYHFYDNDAIAERNDIEVWCQVLIPVMLLLKRCTNRSNNNLTEKDRDKNSSINYAQCVIQKLGPNILHDR